MKSLLCALVLIPSLAFAQSGGPVPLAGTTVVVTDTSADALHVGCAVAASPCSATGGIKAGPIIATSLTVNSVGIVAVDGRIPAISSTYFASLSAANLTAVPAAQVTGANALPDSVLSTNIPRLNATNAFTAANTFVGIADSGSFSVANGSSTGLSVNSSGHVASVLRFDGNSTNVINFGYENDANESHTINLNGYNGGNTRFRDFGIGDGKNNTPFLLLFSQTADNGAYLATTYSLNIGTSARVGRATTNSTNSINMFDGTAPVGAMTNGITLYSTAGELRVMDAAGNATLLSPHDPVTNEWIYSSVDDHGRLLRVDMEKFFKAYDARFGTHFVTDTRMPKGAILLEAPKPPRRWWHVW
jgi:hypothetical protein